MTAPSLSGVAATAVIALCPDRPLLTVDDANQLIRRHELSRELARALVEDRVAATVTLTAQEELALTASRAQAEGLTSEAALEQLLAIAGFCIPAPTGPPMGAVKSRHKVLVELNKWVEHGACGWSSGGVWLCGVDDSLRSQTHSSWACAALSLSLSCL